MQSIRERVLEAQGQGADAAIELVVQLVAEVESLSVRVAALEAEIAALRAKLGTNSSNSSKPPSSDGPDVKPRPRSQRAATGRKSGGQPGHEGHTLRLVEEPDEIKMHTPACCQACGQSVVIR